VVLTRRSGLYKLSSNLQEIHLSFRPSREDLRILLSRCPNLKTVYLAGYKVKTILPSTIKILENSGIRVEIEEVRGRPIEYPRERVEKAIELRNMGMSIRGIAAELRVPRSVVHYWITEAAKTKTREELIK